MFGSGILEVAIGLVFVYLLLSLVCSAVNELLEGWLKNRAKDLERGLRELLQDPDGTGLVKAVYEHPLINGLFNGKYDPAQKGNLPSYIPARSFALALLDMTAPAARPPVPVGGGAAAAPALAPIPERVGNAVRMLVEAAGQDATKARENVEAWFNDSMERVSGWYKRRAQTMIFCIGLAVALVVNADSITIANGLANDKAMRDTVVAAAQGYREQNPAGPPETGAADTRVRQDLKTISSIGLPIGWEPRDPETVPGRIPSNPSGWLLKLIGCLVTACAISLGAPFWFDMLNKIITVRSTIKPPDKPAAAPAK